MIVSRGHKARMTLSAPSSEQAVNTSTIAVPTKKSDRAVAGKKKNKKNKGRLEGQGEAGG